MKLNLKKTNTSFFFLYSSQRENCIPVQRNKYLLIFSLKFFADLLTKLDSKRLLEKKIIKTFAIENCIQNSVKKNRTSTCWLTLYSYKWDVATLIGAKFRHCFLSKYPSMPKKTLMSSLVNGIICSMSTNRVGAQLKN